MDDQYVKEELQVNGEPGNPPDDLPPSDRIILSVVSPGRAFNGLLGARNLNAVIGIAAVTAIILSFATAVVMSSSEIFQQQQEARMERIADEMRQMEGMTDDDVDAFESQGTGSMIGAFIGTSVWIPLMLLISGLIVLPVAKIFERGSQTYIRYQHALSVAALSVVPMVSISLVLAIIQLIAEVDVLTFGLHSLVPRQSVFLHIVLMSFTIPFVWWLVVGGIGTARIARSSAVGPTLTYVGITLLIMGIYGYLAALFPLISPI